MIVFFSFYLSPAGTPVKAKLIGAALI